MNDATPRDAFYYLRNFTTALAWLTDRYADLLSDAEGEFVTRFHQLPEPSQALLVRLIMRRGDCFRSSRIAYGEIGRIEHAIIPLTQLEWIDASPALTLTDLFRLLRRDELAVLFPAHCKAGTKTQFLEAAQTDPEHQCPRTLQAWRGHTNECAYRVSIATLCTHLRLLFFGSFHQDWSEFVLTDLGIFKYESIELNKHSRAFQTRAEIETFYRLFHCRELLHEDVDPNTVLTLIPREPLPNAWLEARRSKLLYQVAHHLERSGDLSTALTVYRQSSHPNARVRSIRVLERASLYAEALSVTEQALSSPHCAAERQRLHRMLPRLRHRLHGQRQPRPPRVMTTRLDLALTHDEALQSVEEHVRRHLERDDTPVVYVENALINSLFGLLCWEAIFAPVRGAFFHRFHSAPMDLFSPDFRQRRHATFERCFARLDDGSYADAIRHTFKQKHGIASPFVAWGRVDDALLELALACIPPPHLKHCFERILDDLRDNTTGLPDLIQFFPHEQRYRMIEVKGPGDRLQDNQTRWLEHCALHEIPVAVAYVTWVDVRA